MLSCDRRNVKFSVHILRPLVLLIRAILRWRWGLAILYTCVCVCVCVYKDLIYISQRTHCTSIRKAVDECCIVNLLVVRIIRNINVFCDICGKTLALREVFLWVFKFYPWVSFSNASLSFVHLTDVFNVHGSVPPKCIPIYIQEDATLHSLFISGNCSTCFGWYVHPSSGAYTTVSTAAIAAGSSNGLTNTRCCRYSCIRSWWWVEVPPETCRAVSRYE